MPDGFIPSLSAFVDSSKRTIKQKLADLLSNPLPYLQQTAGQVNEDAKSFNRTSLAAALGDPMAKAKLKSSMLDTAMNFAPAMTVWHGSPHKFSKFDISKIGTGEGAQAYGHGLYMAESPEVAKTYASTLGPAQGVLDATPASRFQRQIQDQVKRGVRESREEGGGVPTIDDMMDWVSDVPGPHPDSDYSASVKALSRLAKRGDSGSIYKADIPDEAVARFLDWDKPLSQQSPAVRSAWTKTKSALPPNAIEDLGGDLSLLYGKDVTPGDFLGTMASIGGRPDAGEQMLKASGVPGIRYLDGGSRSAGQGSSNFVLFDDQLPRILEINGVPTGLQPWKPGEWK